VNPQNFPRTAAFRVYIGRGRAIADMSYVNLTTTTILGTNEPVLDVHRVWSPASPETKGHELDVSHPCRLPPPSGRQTHQVVVHEEISQGRAVQAAPTLLTRRTCSRPHVDGDAERFFAGTVHTTPCVLCRAETALRVRTPAKFSTRHGRALARTLQ
jgi:hypothetical protein